METCKKDEWLPLCEKIDSCECEKCKGEGYININNLTDDEKLRRFNERDFSGLNLSDSNFDNSNLIDSDFRESIVSGSNFSSATICDANFTDCSFSDSKFVEADMSDVDFRFVCLEGADFSHTSLTDIKMKIEDFRRLFKEEKNVTINDI